MTHTAYNEPLHLQFGALKHRYYSKEKLEKFYQGLISAQRQAREELSSKFNSRHLALAMQSLTMYPMAFPQFTRLIMGQSPADPDFQRDYADFLRQFATAFRPATVGHAAKKTDKA